VFQSCQGRAREALFERARRAMPYVVFGITRALAPLTLKKMGSAEWSSSFRPLVGERRRGGTLFAIVR
jgi:hypothetical protein